MSDKINQFEKLKENLQEQYKINIEEFLEAYKEDETLREMADTFKVSMWAVRAVAHALNLRLAKKYRHHDLVLLHARQDDTIDAALASEIESLNETLEQLSHDLQVKSAALNRERARLKAYRKSERRLAEIEDIKEFVDSIVTQKVEPYVPTEFPKRYSRNFTTQFIVLSDLHAEQLVTKEEVGEANRYDWMVMQSRLENVFHNLELQRQPSDAYLEVLLLGDLINGIIHDSMESASTHLIKAVAMLSELIATHIQQLASNYSEIRIRCVNGNHSRIKPAPTTVNKGFDFEYLIYSLIKQKLSQQDNVMVDISTTGLLAFNVFKFTIGVHHGDYFKGSTGSIERVLKIKEVFKQSTGLDPEILIQGHTHSPQITQMPFGFEIINGSLIGVSQYSHTNGFVGLQSCQIIGRISNSGLSSITPVVLN